MMESNGLKNTDETLPLPNSNKVNRNDTRRKRQRVKKLQKQNPLYDDILSSSDEDMYAADERKSKRRKSNEKSKAAKQTVETENITPKKSITATKKSTPVNQPKSKKSTTPTPSGPGATPQPETSENVKNQQQTKTPVKSETQSTSTTVDKKPTLPAMPTDVNEFISQLVTKPEQQQPQLLKENKIAQRKMQNIKKLRK